MMISLNKIGLLVTGLLFLSCETKKQDIALSGTFVNVSYLEKSNHILLADIPFYAVEMTFLKDSVLFSNGFETGKIAFHKKGSLYTLHNAYQHDGTLQDMQLEATSDSTFIVKDSAYTNTKGNTVFSKSAASFESRLAQTMIAGTYEFIFPETLKTKKVHFTDKEITGFPGYSRYELCYSGDCMQMITDKINAIYLSDANTTTLFGWKYGPDNTVALYNVTAPVPDIKGDQKITTRAYLLKKVQK